jgi:hypothetical protein
LDYWEIQHSNTPLLQHLKSPASGIQAEDFSRCAFGNNLKWSAAHFAIDRELLPGNARVHSQLKALAAKRALHNFTHFHMPISLKQASAELEENQLRSLKAAMGVSGCSENE